MSKKKKTKKTKKIVLFLLLGFLLAIGLFAGYFFLSLPKVEFLKIHNPDTTAFIQQRIAEAQKKKQKLNIHQQWVKFDDIPQLLKDAVRVSEDIDFYNHNGIDFYELKESIKRNLKEGKKARGGSTITQQLAKNLFLSSEKSYYRKLKEFFIARKLEKYLTKNRIFHLYLNVIEFGRGIFGVEAASKHFFHKRVKNLNLEEIIRLVSVIPKPLRVTPLSNSGYLKWRANLLLDRMVKYGFISDKEYERTKRYFR